MRILYIADSTSIHTQRWLNYFLRKGHDVSIITLGKKTFKIPGVHHVKNFAKFHYDSPAAIPILMRTRQIVRAIKPHILHAHFVHQYGWLAALSGFHPLVMTAWGTDILSLPHASRSGLGNLLTQFTLKKSDSITGTSEYMKGEIIKLGANPNKISVIHWGVELERFRPEVDTTDLRLRLSIKDTHKVVLSNRNQIALYNNDMVIRAMASVLKTFPDTILILQNSGGSLEMQLRNLAEEVGISKSVRFLPQFTYDDMPALYALSDVYVSVPSWDGGPVSLVEAMACGAAPIISDVPGPMEWVQDNKNGLVVPIRSIEALTKAICELLSDPEKRALFQKRNKEILRERGDHFSSMRKVSNLYAHLLNRYGCHG